MPDVYPYMKPCPFCGCKVLTPVELFPGQPRFAVQCEQCGGYGPWTLDRDSAIESWNSRKEIGCFKCDDSNTPLYCLNCAHEMPSMTISPGSASMNPELVKAFVELAKQVRKHPKTHTMNKPNTQVASCETTHTATPWRAVECSGMDDDGSVAWDIEVDGHTVAHVYPGENMDADSQFIVKAVNCHDDLLEACKALFGLVESGHLVRDISGDAKPGWAIKEIGLVKALAQAKEAIAKAEGKA